MPLADIRQEIIPYTDGNDLVAPGVVPPGTVRASDNGPLFTSEYFIILAKSGLLTDVDKQDYFTRIKHCIGPDNQLHRSPGDTTEDAPDDHYGVISGHVTLGLTPEFILPLSLWRQPQLLFAFICAKYPLMRLAFPIWLLLSLYSAIVIATSCINAGYDDFDSRRGCWHLIQATQNNSLLCKLASLIWFHRLTGEYGSGGMGLASCSYFLPADTHPLSKYWIT